MTRTTVVPSPTTIDGSKYGFATILVSQSSCFESPKRLFSKVILNLNASVMVIIAPLKWCNERSPRPCYRY